MPRSPRRCQWTDEACFHLMDRGHNREAIFLDQTAAASRLFPLVAPADLLGFLRQARKAGNENPVVRQFRDWIRQRRAASGAP